MREHEEWFKELTGDISGRAAALHAGLPPATLNRQLARNHFTAESVIALARAYGQSPVAAQVATGYITPEEADMPTSEEAARLLPNPVLIRELARRVDDNEEAWAHTFDHVVEEATTPDVQRHLYVADSSPDEPEEGDEGYHDGP